MDEEKSVVEASSFLLFEASGDSEAVSDALSSEIDDDDACSCCCDPSKLQMCGDIDGYDVQSFGADEEEEEEKMDEEWIDDDVGISISSHQFGPSVESTVTESESLNEVEKSRLFWETCLAS